MSKSSLLALLALLTACRTGEAPEPESTLKTDETRQTLRDLCRDVFPEEGVPERIASACECLGKLNEPALTSKAKAYCEGGARKEFERLIALGRVEGVLVMTGKDLATPSAKDLACAAQLAEARAEFMVDGVANACEKERTVALRSLLDLPEEPAAGSCWRFLTMDQDDCVVAAPCEGRGPADLARLPLSPRGAGMVPETARVKLCHPAIKAMHRLKDPRRLNDDFNYAFANYLGMNRSNAHVTYGAANCHGTAQAFAGDFLSKLKVDHVTYHSPTVEEQCGEQARSALALAGPVATGEALPISKGGYVVNMVHDAACSKDQCGKASLQTFSCEGGALEAHVFIQDMCIHCWGELLVQAGWRPMADDATWRDLMPGCIMTANDHSVTLLNESAGMCYFYESLSPFAAPQMNVDRCTSLFDRFGRRWCPQKPLVFSLGSSGG